MLTSKINNKNIKNERYLRKKSQGESLIETKTIKLLSLKGN